MKKKTHPSRLTKALLETADDMHRTGVMDAATHRKITLRHLGSTDDIMVEPMTAWGRYQAFGHGAATSLMLLMVTPPAAKTATAPRSDYTATS